MKAKRVLPFLVLIFLFGCSSQVATPTLQLPTLVVKSTEMPIPSPSLPLTSTLSRAYTKAVLPTSTLNPTQAAKATQQTAGEQNCDGRYNPISYSSLLSKLGKFIAFVCWPLDDKDLSITKVIALDGSRAPIDISYRKDYLGIDYSQPIPQGLQDEQKDWPERYALYPVRWTADEKFLYLEKPTPFSGTIYPQVFALMRLNIETGELTPVLPHTGPLDNLYHYSFSTDGTKLLYIDKKKEPSIVKVADLVTGDEIEISLNEEFTNAGDLMLSPDGTKLVVSAIGREFGIALILVDMLTLSQVYLAKDLHYDFFPISWLDDRTIYGSSYENEQTSFFYIDIVTKQKSPAPKPTPTP